MSEEDRLTQLLYKTMEGMLNAVYQAHPADGMNIVKKTLHSVLVEMGRKNND